MDRRPTADRPGPDLTRGLASIRPSLSGRRSLVLVVLGVATLLIAIRIAIFAARLSATDERVRWLLLITEPTVRPFRLLVDATAARGTIEMASVAASVALLIAWTFVLARIDREPQGTAGAQTALVPDERHRG